jgi:hypothetical protein
MICARHMRSAERKTQRIIDRNGVALRLRDNAKDFFDNTTCPGSGSAVYCYDHDDFVDDVEWAVNVWREAINRDPDGSWEDRFRINCWDLTDDDGSCAGDEIDIGIKDLGAPGLNYGKNINLDEGLMNNVLIGPTERVIMRATLVHELGHALGLDHWAGPGTLMSYQGRYRRNDHRINLCSTYTQAQMSSASDPNSLVTGLSQDCRTPELANRWGTTGVSWARLNRLTCTDIMRIRSQIDSGSGWTSAPPLHCEIITEQTEYAASEIPMLDTNNNEAYFIMDFDLRFHHCGNTPEFDRLEFEIFEIDADNRTNAVKNLYNYIYEIDPLTLGADGFYNIPIILDSRDLIGVQTNPVGTIQVYHSFSEYMIDQNIDNLAMVLRVYSNSNLSAGGVRSEFVAASTGLIRSPILSPVDARITFGVTDMTLGGVSVSTDSLIMNYNDFISSPDLFPYIDNATQKPNVGKVLYVIVPPRNSQNLTDPATNYQVEFTWETTDLEFAAGPFGPALIWVESIEITKEDIPTIADWSDAGGSPQNVTHVDSITYNTIPAQDPCQNRSGSFELLALSDEPLRSVTITGGTTVDAWELYHVQVTYDYIHYGDPSDLFCLPDSPVCDNPALCTRSADTVFGTRTEDFYISISGPTGAIVTPQAVDSVCLFDASAYGEYYTVAANVISLKTLAGYFDDYEFQVRIAGSGKVRTAGGGICGTETYDGSGWVDIESVGSDGIYSIRPEWQNNCNDEAYNVELQYRYRPIGSPSWTELILDTIRLRIDSDNNDCDSDSFDYEVECSPWDSTYPCPANVQQGA